MGGRGRLLKMLYQNQELAVIWVRMMMFQMMLLIANLIDIYLYQVLRNLINRGIEVYKLNPLFRISF